MKRWFILSILVLVAFMCGFSQSEMPNRTSGDGPDAKNKKGEAPKDTIKSVIKVWTLDNQYSTIKPVELDTSTINFHIYNPAFKQSISNTYLGYAGSPYQSNIFFNRDKSEEFYFLRNMGAYRRNNSEVEYFNTTTPYANLMYEQGDQTASRTEQVFKAFYTQNIDSLTNIGFRFNTNKNESQYQMLEATNKFFNLFASRNSSRYNGYLSIRNAKNETVESGGISSSTINRRFAPSTLPVNLSENIANTVTSLSLFTSHEYLMAEIPLLKKLKSDTLPLGFVPRYAFQYSAEMNRYNRVYAEPTVDQDFFKDTYFNTKGSFTDSTLFVRFSHILQLKMFEDNTLKFTFGKRAFLEHEIVSATHPLIDGQRTYKYSNIYGGGEIYSRNSNFWQWNALARFAVLGRNLGDAIVKGTIVKPIVLGADTTRLEAQAWYQDISADVFQEHWQNNHFKWENRFKKQHEVVLNGEYYYSRFHLSGGANYTLLSNYLYNNEKGIPTQYEKEFSVFSAWLDKDFVLGRFNWSNKAVWQEVSDDAVLHLPMLSLYSSFYYSHYLFKVMKIQLGAEVYYHTKFLADSYEPTTTQFYLQNKKLTGGYPLINLFANAKLKRTSAFAMLTHANSMFNFGEFFSSPTYPLEQMAFKFGFLWTFYD